MFEWDKALLSQVAEWNGEPVVACSPGKQPLWRYLLATCEHTDRGREIAGCHLLSCPEPGTIVNAFVAGDVDAIGLIGATFLRLRERVKDSLRLFQPLTWMIQGPVLCAWGETGSVMDLEGLPVASSPLASDLMAYWQALIPHNYGRPLKALFALRPHIRPEELLKERSVQAAFVSGYAWAKIRGLDLSVVTDLRTEWDRNIDIGRMPLMGGLVGRKAWLEENSGLQEALSARLSEGLKLYRSNEDAFLARITSWEGISPELIMDKDEAAYWCQYWGMDQLSEDRLTLSTEDEDELALLERLMRQASSS